MNPSETDAMLEVIQGFVGGCREEIDGDKCWAPAEYVLWGKLIPPAGLGPRCREHAEKHVGSHALYSGASYALIHLHDLAANAVAHNAIRSGARR